MVAIRLKHSSSARTRLPENDPPCSDWCKHLHMFYPAGERVAPPPAPFDSRISGGERSTAVVFRSADWRSGDSRLIGTMFQGVNEIVPRSCSSIPGIGNLDREAAAGIHPAKARYTELGWERINSLPLVVFLTHPLCVASVVGDWERWTLRTPSVQGAPRARWIVTPEGGGIHGRHA